MSTFASCWMFLCTRNLKFFQEIFKFFDDLFLIWAQITWIILLSQYTHTYSVRFFVYYMFLWNFCVYILFKNLCGIEFSYHFDLSKKFATTKSKWIFTKQDKRLTNNHSISTICVDNKQKKNRDKNRRKKKQTNIISGIHRWMEYLCNFA